MSASLPQNQFLGTDPICAKARPIKPLKNSQIRHRIAFFITTYSKPCGFYWRNSKFSPFYAGMTVAQLRRMRFGLLIRTSLSIILLFPPITRANARYPFQNGGGDDPLILAISEAPSPTTMPPNVSTEEANLFYLQNQKLQLKNGNEVLFSKQVFELPGPPISDPNKQLEFSVKGDDLVLSAKGEHTHVIAGIKPIAFVAGNDYLYIHCQNGDVLAVSFEMIKSFIFQSAIPVFKVGNHGDLNHEMTILSRKTSSDYQLNPQLHQSPFLSSGDLAFIDKAGSIEGVLTLDEIVVKAEAGALILALLVEVAQPEFGKSEERFREILSSDDLDLQHLQATLQNPAISEIVKKNENQDMFARLSQPLLAKSLDKIKQLRHQTVDGPARQQVVLKELETNLANSMTSQTESLSGTEGIDSSAQEQLKTAARQFDSSSNRVFSKIKNSLVQLVTSKKIQKLTLALGAMATGYYVDTYFGNAGSQWVLVIATHYWSSLSVSKILMSSTWAWPTIRSTLIIAAILPIVLTIAKLAGSTVGWDTKKTLMVASLRTFGVLQGSFYIFSRYLIRQKNFFSGVRAGVNPLAKPAIMNMPWATNKTMAQNRRQVESSVLKQRKERSLAWILAHQNLMQSENLDPVSLILAEIEISQKPGEKLLSTEDWMLLSHELKKDMKEMSFQDIEKLNPFDLVEMQERADLLSQELHEKPYLLRKLKSTSVAMTNFWKTKVPHLISNLGYDSFRQLMVGEASDVVARHSLRTYCVNFLFSTAFLSFLGARADLSHPENLVANPYGNRGQPVELFEDPKNKLGLNPAYLTDAVNETARWNTMRRASNWLVFEEQNGKPAYLPTSEDIPANTRRESFLQTTVGVTKSLVNLPKANYGVYFIRNLQTTLTTAFAGLIIGTSLRVGLMGQALTDAVPAQLWAMGSGMWMYGWVALMVSRTLISHENELIKKASFFRDTQVRLQQALERNDYEDIEKYFSEYLEFDKGARQQVLQNPTKSLRLTEIQQFLENGFENPPIASRPNEKLLILATVTSAATIAYLASSFTVISFSNDPNWWVRAGHAWVVSLGLYGLVYGTQKGINSVWAKVDQKLGSRFKSAPFNLKVQISRAKSCKGALAPTF